MIEDINFEDIEEFPTIVVEPYGEGFILVDYTDEENLKYRGKTDKWVEGHPFVDDPFETEEEAIDVLADMAGE